MLQWVHRSLFIIHSLSFFLSEIFQELGAFKCINALYIFNIQSTFELSDIVESFSFHPGGEETVGFSDECVGVLIDCAAHFHSWSAGKNRFYYWFGIGYTTGSCLINLVYYRRCNADPTKRVGEVGSVAEYFTGHMLHIFNVDVRLVETVEEDNCSRTVGI